MASIGFILEQLKSNPSCLLERLPIRQMCLEMELAWRERCLDPATTVALFIQQILHSNRSCVQVRHLAKCSFSAQAYCQARKRLPLSVIQNLSRQLCNEVRRLRQGQADDLFLTHRVFVADGSTFSMPDTPALQEAFGQPGMQKEGCGFPSAHLLAMFDLNTGLLIDAIASPLRTHDLADISQLHPYLQEGDILMGDTAFSSYGHFAALLQAKVHGLMPNHQQRIMDFTPHRPHVSGKTSERSKGLPRSRWIRSLAHDDQLVEWFKPPRCPSYLSQEQYDALPESIVVREIRRSVYREELETSIELKIVTTLLDERKYPADMLVQLRLRRWQIEINLKHLKTTMGMEVLKCKTVAGVQKELAVFVLVYNLVRVLMLEAAARQNVKPRQISFTDVLGWMQMSSAGDAMPRFVVNPIRTKRIEPRVIKRRAKPYDLMNRPRAELRQGLKNKAKHG